MALNFKSAPTEKMYTQEEFAGVDFSTQPSKVSPKRSPDSKNMIINQNGYVEKRTGYRRVLESEGNVNGIFEYVCAENNTTYYFVHIGTQLYKFSFGENGEIVLGSAILTGLADKKSRGFTIGGALYIIGAGYIKIAYDPISGALCYGFVNKACTEDSEENAPTIVSGRSKYVDSQTELFGGTPHDYTGNNSYKKIEFARDYYSFKSNPSRLYIAPLEYADRVRVASVYFKQNGTDYVNYTRVKEPNYTVACDSHGLYIQLNYYEADYFAESCTCSPYVIVQYNNFVYAPTLITGRAPIAVTSLDNNVLAEGETGTACYTGETLEGVNLASGICRIDFYITQTNGAAKRYYLEDADYVIGIYVDGVIVQKYKNETNVQTVNANTSGNYIVMSNEAVGSGEHVVTIEYMRTGSRDVIDNCSIYTLYGGDNDTRAFVSGNEKYRSRDFASGLFDASYFSDLQYTDVGSDESAIVGYHKLYGNLIIVKDGRGSDSTQYLRTFALTSDGSGNTAPVFTVKQGNASYGAVNTSSFKSAGGAPLYLGYDGVFLIQGTSVENQNNTVSVSRMVDGRLKKENALDSAVCTCLGGKYYIFTDGHAYICDTKNGYEWFYFDSLPNVRCAWVCGKTLYFGTDEGKIYRFMHESENNAYYDDVAVDGSVSDAKAIEAVWEMPVSTLGEYANYKTVRNCYITCMPYGRSSVKVYYNTNEDYRDWVLGENIDLFSFEDVDFDRFTFNTISAPFVFATGVKVKNVYVFGLRLVNDTAGEPFGFLAVSVKYRSGKYVK